MRVINEITGKNEKFHVSYNPSARDYGTHTTALCINETSQYLILSGDHRKKYEGLDFNAALEYFYKNVNLAVIQSEHGIVFRFENGKASYVRGGY